MARNPAWQCMECGSIRCDGTCPDPQEALDDETESGRPWADGFDCEHGYKAAGGTLACPVCGP